MFRLRRSEKVARQREQYLVLRVLWKQVKFDKFDERVFALGKWKEEADTKLNSYRSWHLYCASFGGKLEEGTFTLARFYQQQILRSPLDTIFRANVAVTSVSPIAHRTRSRVKELATAVKRLSFDTPTERPSTPSDEQLEYDGTSPEDNETPPEERSYGPRELLNLNYPKTKDEQIVNAALIDFLNAFTIHFDLPVYWTLYRKPFTAGFENGSFEARTDGCLEGVDSRVYVIVEVKPMLRERKATPIRMQESAEMVAWIKHEPDPDGFGTSHGQRILISQDRNEIHLIFAEYGESYVRYLNNKLRPGEEPGFLTMHEFGAWDTSRLADMKSLGGVLLAIALRASQANK